MKKKIILSITGLLVLTLALFIVKGAVFIKNHDKETPIVKYLKPLAIKEKVIVLYNYIRIETGGKKSALKTIDKLIEKNPNVAVYYYLRGLTDYMINRVDDFTHAIELIPNDSNLYMHRAIANHYSGNPKESELDFERAIELNPNDSRIYKERAHKRWLKKDNKGQLQDIKKAIELDKSYEYLLYEFYGDKAQKEEKYDKTLEEYTKAIKLNKKTNTSYFRRALCYFSKEEYEKGFDDLKSAIKKDKYDITGYIFMEMFQRATAKDYKKAIKYATKGIRLGGEEFGFLYFNRADSKVALGDFKGAMKDYQKTIELDPENTQAYDMMASIEENVYHNYDKAFEYINKAIELEPDNISLLLTKANIYTAKGEYQKVLEYLEGLIKSGHKDLRIYIGISSQKLVLKDFKGAIETSNKAIKLPDKDNEHMIGLVYFTRGVAKRELDDNEGAIEDLTRAIEKYPEIAKYDMLTTMLETKITIELLYYNRGIARLNIKDYKGAIEDFKKSIVNKNEFNSYYFLGFIEYKLGNYKESLSHLDKAIKLKPDFERAYKVRGYAKFELKDYKGALSDLEKALKFDPDNKEIKEKIEEIIID